MTRIPDNRPFPPAEVQVERTHDGLLLRNAIDLPDSAETLLDRLAHWAHVAPDRIFLTEPVGDGLATLDYAAALVAAGRAGAHLRARGLSVERPLMIVAGNSIAHAVWMLGAALAGIPAAVVSPAYAAPAAAPFAKLAQAVDLVTPGLVLADPVAAAALRTVRAAPCVEELDGAIPAGGDDGGGEGAVEFPVVDADSIAKLLFTSGSTGTPKAVPNTQRMMVSNMRALERVWPFLSERPPVLVDWLPWNHTFGGNCCFNIILYFGGTLHIDQGKPVPALIGRSVAALRRTAPTAYFNVPGGYAALLPWLEGDESLARIFFSRLDMLFNAAAAMPASTRARLEAVARRTIGDVPPILGGWGSTETAPFSTVIYFPTTHAANLGVPLPGTTIKMVDADGRGELRVKGPNVMPGYWRQPEATAAAFDAEGFYRIGDAAVFADADRPEAGLVFDGRLAENFKLASGTWVNVSALRLSIVAAADPLIADLVVAGEGGAEIGVLVFPNVEACAALVPGAPVAGRDVARHPEVVRAIRDKIGAYNAGQTGSSLRVRYVHLLDEAPSAAAGETTDKGYLNQRAVLRNRAEAVATLFDGDRLDG